MSAYNETPDKRIRADFALRIGKLFSGYEKKLRPGGIGWQQARGILMHKLLSPA